MLLHVVGRDLTQINYNHSLPFLKLQFATTLPPIVPLVDDDYLHQELYEAEEQFGEALTHVCLLFHYCQTSLYTSLYTTAFNTVCQRLLHNHIAYLLSV